MNKRLSALLAMVLALGVVSAAPAAARDHPPRSDHRPLAGSMELEFNLGFGDEAALRPDVTWVGTVDLNGKVYGIVFFPTWGKDIRHLHFFREIWKIYPYDAGNPFFELDQAGVLTRFDPEAPLMVGHDSGVSNLRTNRYWAVGKVDNAASPFAGRVGHRMFMRGVIEWYDFGAPHYAPGTFWVR